MEEIRATIKSYIGCSHIKDCNVENIRGSNGTPVKKFRELVKMIASLSFHNPEFLLFFRGQSKDHRTSLSNGHTSLLPSIFRMQDNSAHDLESRYSLLDEAERTLCWKYQNHNFEGKDKINIYRILRWAILQHYEVCSTPFLDVTCSLRVACSFAQNDAAADEETYLYVLGLPQVSGMVTACSEQGIQIVRLLSICPPDASRPHFQEGYVIGDFPDISTYEIKTLYERTQVDFGRRLIAKFRLGGKRDFWDLFYQPFPKESLFPEGNEDRFLLLAADVKRELRNKGIA
jgi:hypothetical protein